MTKKGSQLPFTFNNDQDVKRVRDSLKATSTADLNLLLHAAELERSNRFYSKTYRKTETKDALAGFLDKINFDYFCTFTTRKPVSLFATRRIAEKVCEYVDAGHSSSVFWAAEEFDVRDGFHFHALMRTDVNRMQIFDWYFRKYGRCDLIDNREPERQKAASHYVAKYVTKRITDYDLMISKYHMR